MEQDNNPDHSSEYNQHLSRAIRDVFKTCRIDIVPHELVSLLVALVNSERQNLRGLIEQGVDVWLGHKDVDDRIRDGVCLLIQRLVNTEDGIAIDSEGLDDGEPESILNYE
jgi:hypothetical protein